LISRWSINRWRNWKLVCLRVSFGFIGFSSPRFIWRKDYREGI